MALEDQRGAYVRRLSLDEAALAVSRGVAFAVGAGRLRLADRRDVGSGMDRRTAPTVSGRQIELAAEAWGRDAGYGEEPARAARYQARRIAVWATVGMPALRHAQ